MHKLLEQTDEEINAVTQSMNGDAQGFKEGLAILAQTFLLKHQLPPEY